MASTQQVDTIWTQMSYQPPRGPCSQKTSMLSTCPCYRFMIHPLKAATSFDCDGCGHHASFHRMESREEQEIQQRWASQEPGALGQQISGRERLEAAPETIGTVTEVVEFTGKRRRIEGQADEGQESRVEPVIEVMKSERRKKRVGGRNER